MSGRLVIGKVEGPPGPEGQQGIQGPAGPQGVPGPGFPTGGATGSILSKASVDDYDAGWETLSSIGSKLVEPSNPVGASLSQKAAKSVQEKVEKTTVSARTITVAANEFQSQINALPRLVTENLELKVTGNLDTLVAVENFYGSGSITIVAGSGGFTLSNKLRIRNCSVYVNIMNVEFQDSGVIVGDNGLLMAELSRYVYVYNCGFTGLGTESYASAVEAISGTRVRLSSARISGFQNAVIALRTAVLSVDGSGSAFQGNTFGAAVLGGGIVLLGSNIPNLLGGSANKKQGGLIAKADGTLL